MEASLGGDFPWSKNPARGFHEGKGRTKLQLVGLIGEMINRLKQRWQSLKRGKPGHRFRSLYDAARKTKKDASFGFKILRLMRFVVALAAALIGVVLVFIPGPAILFFLLAGSLLAAESLTIARFLDWTEVKLRAVCGWCLRQWHRLHFAGKIAITGLAAAGATGCAYAAYRFVTG